MPSRAADLFLKDGIVVSDDGAHFVRVLFPKPSRSFDVGEEEYGHLIAFLTEPFRTMHEQHSMQVGSLRECC